MGLGSSLGFGSSKTKVPAQGFYALPKEYQDLWTNILGQTSGVAGKLNTDAFTPMPQTAEESRAIGLINQGLGTEDTFNRNVSMLMNPFNDYVINDLNRQAAGENSLVNQAAAQAGQMGSNRSFLGTSDVEQNRLNNIGMFRQNQYNTAVANALGPLAGLQQQDIENLFNVGDFQRGIDFQTKQAPYAALQANQGALAGIPTQFGNFGSPAYTIKSGGGLGGVLGGIGGIGKAISGAGGVAGALGYGQTAGALGGLGSALAAFSDERMKDEIELYGIENGHNIYKFHYTDDPFKKKYIGVMAQEVIKTRPDAVSCVMTDKGSRYYVDYGALGLTMRAS